ncbi:MAG: hypothetical protein CMC15_14765, partial [Flavobacteriaceae bacterium]|nr:hypothetical protein [Flavobacteriaceae bacterium]
MGKDGGKTGNVENVCYEGEKWGKMTKIGKNVRKTDWVVKFYIFRTFLLLEKCPKNAIRFLRHFFCPKIVFLINVSQYTNSRTVTCVYQI